MADEKVEVKPRPDTTPPPQPISEQIADSLRHALRGGVLNPEDLEKMLLFVTSHPVYATPAEYPNVKADAPPAAEPPVETPPVEESEPDSEGGFLHRKKKK